MRLIIIFILCLVLLAEGILFILFTAPGNDMLLPFINRYLTHKIPQAKIEITKLRFNPSTIGVIAKVNDTVDVRAKGDINLLAQIFDINYTLDTQMIKTPALTIKEHINIRGNAKGSAEDMHIAGNGLAFKSKIRYTLSLLKQYPKDIKIDISDADLRSLLLVANQPAYATGHLTVHADMPDFTPLNPQINAVLGIKDGVIDNKRIAKDFGITLPAKTTYQTDFVIKTQNRHVTFDGNINSSLANLALKDGTYQLLSNTLHAQYQLNVPKLQKLSILTQTPLQGKFVLGGTLSLKNNIPTVTGSTKSFGGKTVFNYHADTLTASLSHIRNATLLRKLGQPAYLSGNSTINLKLSSIKNLTGFFETQTVGTLNKKVTKKAWGLDLGKKFTLNTHIKGTLKNQKLTATMISKTTMANIKATPITLDLKSTVLAANYLVDIPDMGNLQPLTTKRFKGKIRINGTLKKAKDLLVTGHGKEFGGAIDFTLKNNLFNADVTGVTVSKVMTMLDYPQVLEAISKAKVHYNTTSSAGTLHATLDNAKILPNKLTKLLKQFRIIDLTKERFNNSTFDAKITKKLIDFTLDARNKNNFFIIKNGKLNKKSGAINAKVDMKIKGKDLQATIRGTTDNPKVSLDGSKYLQEKVKEKILKSKIGEKFKKKLEKKLKGKTGSKIKDLVKGMF